MGDTAGREQVRNFNFIFLMHATQALTEALLVDAGKNSIGIEICMASLLEMAVGRSR